MFLIRLLARCLSRPLTYEGTVGIPTVVKWSHFISYQFHFLIFLLDRPTRTVYGKSRRVLTDCVSTASHAHPAIIAAGCVWTGVYDVSLLAPNSAAILSLRLLQVRTCNYSYT